MPPFDHISLLKSVIAGEVSKNSSKFLWVQPVYLPHLKEKNSGHLWSRGGGRRRMLSWEDTVESLSPFRHGDKDEYGAFC